MNLAVVLSNDWELFGDGSGDFETIQSGPGKTLMRIAEKHGAKMTFMAETGQQKAHLALAATHAWAADASAAWEAFLQDAATRGHGVEAHLHPQWLASNHGPEGWKLGLDWWALPNVPEATRKEALKWSKEYLETIVRKKIPGYHCHAFRAGSFCMMPSHQTSRELLALGIDCDSSVCKGQSMRTKIGGYDYRSAHSYAAPYDANCDDIRKCRPGSGLLEMPILSRPATDLPLLRKLGLFARRLERIPTDEKKRQLERRRRLETLYPSQRRPISNNPDIDWHWLADKLIRRGSLVMDYDFVPPSVIIETLRAVAENHQGDGVLPVTLIGHAKNMVLEDDFDALLSGINATFGGTIRYLTLKEASQQWRQRRS
ncbi:MAG: hypothetical protein AABZ44_04730 [Elusimicrobiota bacterium]